VNDLTIADPDDLIFIACADSADAEYLISSDDHLLRLKQYGKIKIVNPSGFVRAVESKTT
jgi:predicted nucleic acid-binding protein